jgi:glycosyltransferase involved in cell wall biosynthesis
VTEQPLVCICIPTYNSACTLKDMLLSILSQTYRNLVVHISDNASTDDTLKVIESVADHRVHIHRNATNVGAEENFNNCIRLAQGKYMAILHADDLYEPQMLECQVAFLENHVEAGAVFTAASVINETGKRFGEIN